MEERLLQQEFEVIGKVRNGQALFEEAMRLKPDVIVADISMPILSGIEAADAVILNPADSLEDGEHVSVKQEGGGH